MRDGMGVIKSWRQHSLNIFARSGRGMFPAKLNGCIKSLALIEVIRGSCVFFSAFKRAIHAR